MNSLTLMCSRRWGLVRDPNGGIALIFVTPEKVSKSGKFKVSKAELHHASPPLSELFELYKPYQRSPTWHCRQWRYLLAHKDSRYALTAAHSATADLYEPPYPLESSRMRDFLHGEPLHIEDPH